MQTFDSEATGKVMTWRQLRDFCASIDEEWLDKQVKVETPSFNLDDRTLGDSKSTDRVIYAGPNPSDYVFAQSPHEVVWPEGAPLLRLEIVSLLEEE